MMPDVTASYLCAFLFYILFSLGGFISLINIEVLYRDLTSKEFFSTRFSNVSHLLFVPSLFGLTIWYYLRLTIKIPGLVPLIPNFFYHIAFHHIVLTLLLLSTLFWFVSLLFSDSLGDKKTKKKI